MQRGGSARPAALSLARLLYRVGVESAIAMIEATLWDGSLALWLLRAQPVGGVYFRTIGKAGLVVGRTHAHGRVYKQGEYLGDTAMMRGSLGFAGGWSGAEPDHLLENLARSTRSPRNPEFGADVKASAIKASAGTSAGMTRGGPLSGAPKSRG